MLGETLTPLVERIKEATQEYEKALTKVLMKGVFERYPTVRNFGFVAITPYFNDGDLCTNSIHNVIINGSYEENYDDDEEDETDFFTTTRETIGWGANEKSNPDFNPENRRIAEEISELIYGAEDALHSIYGTNTRVVFHRDGLVDQEEEEPGY